METPASKPERYPLRVEEVLWATVSEWRIGEGLSERSAEAWQLVYVYSGMIEECCDSHRIALRAGRLLFHQPEEIYAMRAVGEVPPEVLRVEFVCTGAAMDAFRGYSLRVGTVEQVCLRSLAAAAKDCFSPASAPDLRPELRPNLPFGAQQMVNLCLEQLLILLARRQQRTRRPGARALRERDELALVDGAKLYFAAQLRRDLKLEEVCAALGCSRVRLQNAFRTRTGHGPMECFASMKLEHACQLLAAGSAPGEVAAQLGYSSGAYFSHRFRQAMGQSPSEYARAQRRTRTTVSNK